MLREELAPLVRQHEFKEGVFSKVSASDCQRLMERSGFHTGAQLPLPASIADVGTVDCLAPFVWETPSKKYSETQASPLLRPKLEAWLRSGASPALDDVHFKNVEQRTGVPLVAESDQARFTGVPDLVALRRGLNQYAFSVWLDTVASWDWKTQEKFANRTKVAAQATLQVLGFANQWEAIDSPPVFFSDMSTGVRCWIMVGGTIYAFHGTERDLTLEEGVRLTRYFIANNGRLLDADLPRASSRAHGPATGGAGTGDAAGGGPFTPGPKRSGGGGASKRAGSGSHSYRDAALGKGSSAAGGGRESPDVPSRESPDVPSRDSSPDDSSRVSDDDVELFKIGLAEAVALVKRCGADLSDAYDLSE